MAEISRLNDLEIADKKARQQIENLSNDIPTKNSQLENDSNFVSDLVLTSDGEGHVTMSMSSELIDGNEVEW